MATRVLAPSFGEGVEELTVVNWLKKEGETVKEMEVIVELETDKVTTEIPSPAAGVLLKILAQKDEVVKVGSILAWVGQPGDALESEIPTIKKVIPTGAPKPVAVEPSKTLEKSAYTGPVSPLVKNIVAANNVDLNLVQGTGQGGRITREDVQVYVEPQE